MHATMVKYGKYFAILVVLVLVYLLFVVLYVVLHSLERKKQNRTMVKGAD